MGSKSLFIACTWCFLGILFCTGIRLWDRFGESKLRVTFFDVGQGDSALVRFPGGRTLLIDGGGGWGEWDLGGELTKELSRMSVLTLDDVVLSHPDADHVMGFGGIFSRLRVGNFWVHSHHQKEWDQIHGLARLPLSRVRRRWVSGEGGSGETPFEIVPTFGRNRNDRALVVSLQWHGCRFLFTGDVSGRIEKRLLRSPRIKGPYDVVKVAHHGSKTSSTPEWIRGMSPQWAVISSGWKNRYGHPHDSVVKRWLEAGTQVLGTHTHGFVEFEVSAEGSIRCRSHAGVCGSTSCLNPAP